MTSRSLASAVALTLLGLVTAFQNCAPPNKTTEEDLYSGIENGDSSFRLPAGFEETLNTGVTCSATAVPADVAINGNVGITVAAVGTVPPGFRVYAYGSKNGVADASEISPTFATALTQSTLNTGSIGGSYIRYFQIRDNLGRVLCQTNQVGYNMVGQGCTLSVSASTVRSGQAVTFTTTYRAGTAVPTGAIVRFEGQNNGLAITPIPYDSTNFNTYTRTMSGVDVGNTYIRRIVILNANQTEYCRTNDVRVTVLP